MIVLKAIAITVAVLGGLGLVFGLILALASKIFAVEEDPRKDLLMEIMPGANCGACGFAGCAAYVDAVLEGTTVVGVCPVGGTAVAEKMASIMGVTDVGAAIRQVALVRCNGNGSNRSLYRYEGIEDCLAASRVAAGGPLACLYGCLAFGTCVKVCDFNAISIKDGCAVVNMEKCVGCLKCVNACPRNLITVVPYGSDICIKCASRDKGVDTHAVCDCGCIGCGLCAKACPNGAVTVENHLAVIDYSKCTACGACIEKCPQHLIRRASESHEEDDASILLIPET